MSKLNSRWIDFGVGSDQVSGQQVPSNFTPSNYTSTQVASEGVDKISAHLNGIDLKIGQITAGYVDEFFTPDGIVTSYQLVTDISASSSIDVFWNGLLLEETADWTRNESLDQINISPALTDGTRLRVRIYTSNVYTDQFYTGDNSTTVFTFSAGFTSENKIDVMYNGQLLEEGGSWDYTRNAATNQITTLFTPQTGTRLRVRVFS